MLPSTLLPSTVLLQLVHKQIKKALPSLMVTPGLSGRQLVRHESKGHLAVLIKHILSRDLLALVAVHLGCDDITELSISDINSVIAKGGTSAQKVHKDTLLASASACSVVIALTPATLTTRFCLQSASCEYIQPV